jgi:hypothetical protein
MLMAGFGQKAELKQVLISEGFWSGVGQEQPFEQTMVFTECSGSVNLTASIDDPVVIIKILAHLDEKAATARLPECRAPPATGLFD